MKTWWLKRHVNRAHSEALTFHCLTDGRQHRWDWDWTLGKTKFGTWAWNTPFGDWQSCGRCEARRFLPI